MRGLRAFDVIRIARGVRVLAGDDIVQGLRGHHAAAFDGEGGLEDGVPVDRLDQRFTHQRIIGRLGASAASRRC